MKIDAFATEPHYLDHLEPIWRALPKELRGDLFVGDDPRTAGRVAELGIPDLPRHVDVPPARPGDPRSNVSDRPTIVAAHRDLRFTPRARPVIFVEHGVGQTYVGVDHGGYPGGRDRENVALFLCPNERVAARNRDRYPGADVEVIGSPFVESSREILARPRESSAPETRSERRTVAISFHWDCTIAKETRSAWSYYRQVIPRVAAAGYRVLGHTHPKLWPRAGHLYAPLGAEPVEDFRDVVRLADLYAVDNSSTLYEFAAITDRPVLALDAPWYRPDVEHGLRFWNEIPGLRHPTVETALAGSHPRFLTGGSVTGDGREGLVEAIAEALEDPPEVAERRKEVVGEVFGEIVGSTDRAVDAILRRFP